MSNHHLRNKAMSLKARVCCRKCCPLPEDWDYILKACPYQPESIDAIRTAVWGLKRLDISGRSRDATESKMADMVYTIYEQPVLRKTRYWKIQHPDNPSSGNPTQLNKDIQTTYLPKTEKINTDYKADGCRADRPY